jgi:hypothetical protein
MCRLSVLIITEGLSRDSHLSLDSYLEPALLRLVPENFT